MGIQNMVCPSFMYSDAWLVVVCTSQNMWHLLLTSPAQRQINHHGNPPSVNHPNLDQYQSNLHAPATVLCVSLLWINGSLFIVSSSLFRGFYWHYLSNSIDLRLPHPSQVIPHFSINTSPTTTRPPPLCAQCCHGSTAVLISLSSFVCASVFYNLEKWNDTLTLFCTPHR